MKRLLLPVLLLGFGNCFAQQWLWGRSAACQHQSSEGWLVKTDPFNNIYIAGENESDTLCLGSHYFFGASKLLLAKYDSSGNVLWTATNSSGTCSCTDIAADAYGNVYATGVFYDLDVQFGPYTLVNPNPQSTIFRRAYFIVKYSSSGNVIWATAGDNIRGMGGARDPSLKIDHAGNLYLTGDFVNPTLQIGNTTLSNTSLNSKADIFIAKYDTAGHPVWAKSFGSPDDDLSVGIAVGNDNDLYFAGYFQYDSITLGNTTLHRHPFVAAESFLMKLDTSDQVLWARGTWGGGRFWAVINDIDGNIYVGGRVLGNLLVLGSDSLHSPIYGEAALLAKYSPSGSVIWAKAMPAISIAPTNNWDNTIFDLAVDRYNNIWACGQLVSGAAGMQVDNTDTLAEQPPAVDPAFIVCYCPGGQLLDHMAFPSGGDDYSGIIADNAGNIYWCGDFMSVDPFVLGDSLPLYGTEDLFVAKYRPSPSTATLCPPVEHVSQQVSLAGEVALYPNPANNTVTIQLGGSSQNATALLYDITGRLMAGYFLNGSATTISVADLPPGIYQCRISEGGHNTITKKLVIMH